jgi:pimeloyl-ACP methyl ester carboxylesterase
LANEPPCARADAVIFNGCFGWLHMPAGPAHSSGVVLCNPFGAAAVGTHRNWREFAMRLAAAGFPTLRFDYPGTGDSAEPDREDLIEAWIASIYAAISHLKAYSGVEEITLCGFRFGASLAAEAAAARPGVGTRLVLLAPPASGEAYLRELEIAAGTRGVTRPADGSLEADGLHLSVRQCATLQAMDLPRALVAARLRQVLVLQPSWQAAHTAPLLIALRNSGTSLREEAFPGYRHFMLRAYKARAPEAEVRTIIDWLGTPGAIAVPPRVLSSAPLSLRDGVTESAFCFGADAGLFGIGCLPPRPAPGAPAALIVNTGAEPRTGNSRLGVLLSRRLADAGVATFRMDVTGFGDSARPALEPAADPALTEDQYAWLRVFRPEFVHDVDTAIEELGRRGFGSCLVIGLCSGANLALYAAMRNPTVAGIVLINPSLVDRSTDALPPVPCRAEQKRLGNAVRRLIDARWRTRIRNAVGYLPQDARCLAARCLHLPALLPARSRWIWSLRSRGITLLAISSEGDNSIREWRRYAGRLWPDAGGTTPGLPLIIRGESHSFEPIAMREALIETIAAHVAKYHLPAAIPAQAAHAALGSQVPADAGCRAAAGSG